MLYMQEYSACASQWHAKVINTHTHACWKKHCTKLINEYNSGHALFFFTLRYG